MINVAHTNLASTESRNSDMVCYLSGYSVVDHKVVVCHVRHFWTYSKTATFSGEPFFHSRWHKSGIWFRTFKIALEYACLRERSSLGRNSNPELNKLDAGVSLFGRR